MLQQNSNLKTDFVLDLMFGGSVAVPAFLLAHYRELEIDAREMMVLIHLFALRQQEQDYYPTPEQLESLMGFEAEEIKALLASLMEKNILGVEKMQDPETGVYTNSYSFQGLMQQLAALWTAEQARLAREKKRLGEMAKDPGKEPEGVARLTRVFEGEFGRPLSPIELAQIIEWVKGDAYREEIVLAALKRAVLRGILNLKYIDRILREWDKKNLRTLKEIEAADEKFQEKQPKKNRRARKEEKPLESDNDKFRGFYVNLK
jgi:DNA replication protein